MNKPPQAGRELFDAYLDGEISSSDLQRLEAWIAADEGYAAEFLSWMSLQTGIYEALKGDEPAPIEKAVEYVIGGMLPDRG
jgi:anti-sigma factor RsiW